jgi:FAD/FMN-containing dehydrogenase
MSKAGEVLRFWRDFIQKAPDELNGWFGFVTVPPVPMFPAEHHLEKACVVTWCYTGDLAKAQEAFRPIREFLKPMMDYAGPLPFPALQSLFDALYPAGLQWYWKADFFESLPDKAIDLHVKYGERLPTPHSTMHLYPIDGAAGRVGKGETAFNFRDARFAEVVVGVDPDPANNPKLVDWARDYWLALHPFSAGGGYVNMMMDEGEENVRAAYRDSYARLAQVKRAYDPGNLFRVNQNVKPA